MKTKSTMDLWHAAEAGDIERLQQLVHERHEEFGYPGRETLQTRDNVLEAMPLHFAVEKGQLDAVKYLLSENVDPHPYDAMQVTPLHVAAACGHVEILELLLAQHVDVKLTDSSGDTALHWAATKGHVACINALLDKASRVDAQNKQGWTPLHRAAFNGRADAIDTLLTRGASLTAVEQDGNTALHLAGMNNMYRAMQVLLGWGAQTRAVNHAGKAPRECCNINAADLIDKYEADHSKPSSRTSSARRTQMRHAAADEARGVRLAVAPSGAPSAELMASFTKPAPKAKPSPSPESREAEAAAAAPTSVTPPLPKPTGFVPGALPKKSGFPFEDSEPALPSALAGPLPKRPGSVSSLRAAALDAHSPPLPAPELDLDLDLDRPGSGRPQLPKLQPMAYAAAPDSPGGRVVEHPWLKGAGAGEEQARAANTPPVDADDYQDKVRAAARRKQTEAATLLRAGGSSLSRGSTAADSGDGREVLRKDSQNNKKFLEKYGLQNKGLFAN